MKTQSLLCMPCMVFLFNPSSSMKTAENRICQQVFLYIWELSFCPSLPAPHLYLWICPFFVAFSVETLQTASVTRAQRGCARTKRRTLQLYRSNYQTYMTEGFLCHKQQKLRSDPAKKHLKGPRLILEWHQEELGSGPHFATVLLSHSTRPFRVTCCHSIPSCKTVISV